MVDQDLTRTDRRRGDVFVLEGRAAPVSGDDEAVLVLSMIDEIGFPAIRIEGSELLVITAASDQIRVVLGDDAVLVPRSEERGPWRHLRAHPAAPEHALDLDRRVTLRGAWVLAGEPVAVAAVHESEGFVVGTGGPRSAPLFERRVRALAIAVGAGARGAVERVIEARRRRLA